MTNSTVHEQLLHDVQGRAAEMRRWLDTTTTVKRWWPTSTTSRST